jgi:carboxypeptidase PM20D1
MIKKMLLFFLVIILMLTLVLFIKTLMYKSRQIAVEPVAAIALSDKCIQHLSEAVQIPTVSADREGVFDSVPFNQLIAFLSRTYPLADTRLHKKIINKLSLLYTWKGKNPALKPMILIGHMDVVPAGNTGGEQWEFPPFSGQIKDGAVFGRGTLDDKVNVVGILEAVEMLLKQGYEPERTIYLAFGHDEEIGGQNGAAKIAEYLEAEHVKAGFLLDEGLVVTKGIVPGIARNVALIGISEKGYVSVELTVETDGGHSSMPPKETSIGILAKAVTELEKHPMPAQLSAPVLHFLDYVGPEMPFLSRMAFANQWLLKNMIISKYETSNAGSALVRTTTAPTLFKSGTKDNVLPGYAAATLNFRILPGETTDAVMEHIKKTIGDKRVKIKEMPLPNEPSPVSEIDCPEFKCLQKSIAQIFANTIIAPSLVLGATDARHYSAITQNLYRFVPLIAESDDLKRIHGVNEKISSADFLNAVRFYRQLILNAQ